MSKNLIKMFVTAGYVGCIQIMPGTFGSLLAFPLCWLVSICCFKFNLKFNIPNILPVQQELLTILTVEIGICIFLFIAGIKLTNLYLNTVSSSDPKEVVIDEVVGQMLVILLSSANVLFASNSYLGQEYSSQIIDFIFLILIPFISFRFFDIVKPWPISWFDQNIKGGLGVMLDDIIAAIFASLTCYAVTFLLISN